MRSTWADLQREFAEIGREAEHLSRLLERVGRRHPDPDSQEVWEAAHIGASATEKLYTGCERIMARVAADIDGAPIVHAAGWHGALLRRLSTAYPGIRDALISRDCFERLERLRSFRHRERNSYGINLDAEIVFARSHEAVAAFDMFRAEVAAFFGSTAKD